MQTYPTDLGCAVCLRRAKVEVLWAKTVATFKTQTFPAFIQIPRPYLTQLKSAKSVRTCTYNTGINSTTLTYRPDKLGVCWLRLDFEAFSIKGTGNTIETDGGKCIDTLLISVTFIVRARRETPSEDTIDTLRHSHASTHWGHYKIWNNFQSFRRALDREFL